MDYIPILLDVGLFVYFLANYPQLKLIYKNRYKLKDLSLTAQVLYLIGNVCLLVVNYSIGGKIAPILNFFSLVTTSWTLYWIIRSRQNV